MSSDNPLLFNLSYRFDCIFAIYQNPLNSERHPSSPQSSAIEIRRMLPPFFTK